MTVGGEWGAIQFRVGPRPYYPCSGPAPDRYRHPQQFGPKVHRRPEDPFVPTEIGGRHRLALKPNEPLTPLRTQPPCDRDFSEPKPQATPQKRDRKRDGQVWGGGGSRLNGVNKPTRVRHRYASRQWRALNPRTPFSRSHSMARALTNSPQAVLIKSDPSYRSPSRMWEVP